MNRYFSTVPKFKTEDEERKFWSTHDTTDYFDWDDSAVAVLPNLKPTTKTTSLRLPISKLESLKLAANKRAVPYQSLIKVFLKERLDEEVKV